MRVLSDEERIKILSDIVSIKTVNSNELEVAHYFERLFSQYGIRSHIDTVTDGRANLIATVGSSQPVIGISGHMDVVSEGNHDDWTYDPFTLTENQGYLYGRGAADMKSGLAALAIALIEIKESGKLTQGTIKFMATVGEEMEQSGSQQLFEKGYADDLDALLIAEPSFPSLVYAHKGSMDFRIKSKGRASHSSIPFLGQNAIKPLLEFIQNINQEYEKIMQTVKGESLDFSNMINKLENQLPSHITKEKAQELIQGLVMTNSIVQGGTQVNSVPDFATAEFNVRTIPEYNNNKVKALFNKYVEQANHNGASLTQELYLDLEPVVTTGQNRLVELGFDIAKSHFSNERDLIITPTVAVTDASNLLKGKDENFPFLMFGPGNGPHQINECVEKANYLEFVEYYIEFITSYLNEENE
ncbi:ArgE/DapE family deacylase [Staphylococcus epidermidis]|uniref:ArgE/DapE family deacylase n=1 Tax=Staphylococcus epidermidis TaxID=1282 RepID=UPI001F3EAB35|nr:ArgE/DapE family deacylase [Staphylococcus epidermidis]MCF7581607.1 ArgE/DapE family deacylase [Staphylococcus epidermidis]MCT2081874.1 ArgE/DapE family deacylase [Staphylococcus epidermidis]MCT2113155.1 ArgE/DapE family deacylase [Staphylococcus epidermidis]MCT2231875.1 ArgE/DapE family deacylase [Staphylococcus epidermidis]MCT2316666.1 ArgE/DapE family deacylase [Staphylococcus epidermidis]